MTLAARLLLGGLLALSLGACGSATPSATVESDAPTPVVTPGPTLTPATPSPAPTATLTPVATAAAGALPCGTADLKASHGLAEGAAGSILTEIVLESDAACTIEASPSLGLQDKSGNAVIAATPAGSSTIELTVGGTYTTQVRLANWCKPEPAFPLALILWIDNEKLVVTGGSFPDGGMPGCLGTGGAELQSNPWVASP